MPRPSRCRRICSEPAYSCFMPKDTSSNEKVVLLVDEYEVIRLIDLEKMTHEQCAKQMDISRTTVTEIYERARKKIAECIVNGKPMLIKGGHYRLCDGSAMGNCLKKCNKLKISAYNKTVKKKGESEMRIAVTYENGNIFQHFGHTEQFKIYDIEEGVITNERIIDTNGSGHGALADILSESKVDILICGGIGNGAKIALYEAGIRLYGGVSGMADDAVKSLLTGKLEYNPDIQCEHHSHNDHNHKGCRENKHSCGGNGGGCH